MVGRVKPQSSEPPVSKMRIGTSGWTYDGWRGPFYPPDISKREWLAFYGGSFSTTEINGSFYRTPSLEAVTAWRDQTPDDFLFAWKASKFITHWKRLTEKCENRIALMETRLRVLRAKAGPVLFQLPARFTVNRERLAAFIRMLPNRYEYAFEFRHQSWYDDAIFDLLRENDISLCLSRDVCSISCLATALPVTSARLEPYASISAFSRLRSMMSVMARNASGTPWPVAAAITSGVVFATRLSRASCCLSCAGVRASALFNATISGLSASPCP